MKRKIIFLTFLAVLTLAVSCNKNEVYFVFQGIDNGSWDKDSVVSFELDSLPFNPLLKYNMELEVVHSSVYPYRDLWIGISHNLIDTLFVQDSLKVELVNDAGDKAGSGNAGLYHLSVPYKNNIAFDSTKVYCINVGHIMRDNEIKGIHKIGVKIYEADINN